MINAYTPGHSLIHRCPAWVKLGLLCLGGAIVMFIASAFILGGALALVGFGYALAKVPARVIGRMAATLVGLVVVIAGCQWYFSSWIQAVLVGERVVFLVAAANLVTWTTPAHDLIATVETVASPLRRFGLRPDRVGVAIFLALRFIPAIAEQAGRIRQAQTARGVRSPFTYLAPLIIKVLRMADGVGEALEVRSGSGKVEL